MEEREASERKTDGLQKKLQELFSSLKITLGGDLGQPTTTSFDKLMTVVSVKDSKQIRVYPCISIISFFFLD